MLLDNMANVTPVMDLLITLQVAKDARQGAVPPEGVTVYPDQTVLCDFVVWSFHFFDFLTGLFLKNPPQKVGLKVHTGSLNRTECARGCWPETPPRAQSRAVLDPAATQQCPAAQEGDGRVLGYQFMLTWLETHSRHIFQTTTGRDDGGVGDCTRVAGRRRVRERAGDVADHARHPERHAEDARHSAALCASVANMGIGDVAPRTQMSTVGGRRGLPVELRGCADPAWQRPALWVAAIVDRAGCRTSRALRRRQICGGP